MITRMADFKSVRTIGELQEALDIAVERYGPDVELDVDFSKDLGWDWGISLWHEEVGVDKYSSEPIIRLEEQCITEDTRIQGGLWTDGQEPNPTPER